MDARKRHLIVAALSVAIFIAVVTLGSLLGYAPSRVENKSPVSSSTDVTNSGRGGVVTQDGAVTSEGKDLNISGGAPEDASVPQASTISAENYIIKNGQLSVRVKSADAAVKRLRAEVERFGARITDLSMMEGYDGVIPLESGTGASKTGGPVTAYVTIRVDADKLDALTEAAARLGDVTSRSESAADVTEQAVDLEARLKNLRAEEDRLRSFLTRTNVVKDLLAVESELSRVRGEIEAMDAQLTYLKRQSAKATLTVTLSEPSDIVSPEGDEWGIRDAITKGVRDAVSLLTGGLALLIAMSPILALALVGWIVARTIIRRRARNASQDADEG